MVITKQMNIKSRSYYFHNDLIKLFDFDPKMLKFEKEKFKGINLLYWICYRKRRIQD